MLLFVATLRRPNFDSQSISVRLADYFAGRPLKKLPKKVEEQIAADVAAAEDAADEVQL